MQLEINNDMSQRVVMYPIDASEFIASPLPGVWRRMLDREGAESGRATSIVRYEPNSTFSRHVHGGGEEILVLEGIFSDEHGDYGPGTYLRHPPGSSHAPFSENGCLLFVKLWQFSPTDQTVMTLDTRSQPWLPGLVPGLSVMPLHEHDGVSTALVRWAPHTQFSRHRHAGGEEILVLEGEFADDKGVYPAGSWIRNPRWSEHAPFTTAQGALIYVKVGHIGATTVALPPRKAAA